MYIFGDKNTFGIGYKLHREEYVNDEVVIAHPKYFEWRCYGFFWVNGKNIFQVRDHGPEATFCGEVSMLMNFFCDTLQYHIVDDPFPMNTKSKVGVEMMHESSLVEGEDNDIHKYMELDWDKVDMELHGRIDTWNINHGIRFHGAGLFLPFAYMQKVEDKVEISWEADCAHHTAGGDFFFEYTKGVEYFDIKLYKDTVVEFCQHVMTKFKSRYPELVNELENKLQKAIDIDVSSTH